MADLFTIENLIAFLTLSALEIVLGIDNIVFITILVSKLPESARLKAMRIGLGLAMGMRILLLFGIKWVMGLTKPFFAIMGHNFTGRDLILLAGGTFLIAKSTMEIHEKLEGPDHDEHGQPKGVSFKAVLFQIMMLDIVFSLDSVITAVGMAKEIVVMIAAVVTAVGVMMVFANRVERFVSSHPTIKMLALSFLILIGVMLVAEGFGRHVEHGYIYFAMAFSLIVEILNIRMRKKHQPVKLHSKMTPLPVDLQKS